MKKIIFYVQGRASLGHITRCQNIIKELLSQSTEINVVSVLNSSHTQILQSKRAKVINVLDKLKNLRITNSGKLNGQFNSIFVSIIENEKPDMIIFDTFYSINVCKQFPRIKKVLILRKYYDEEIIRFFKEGNENYFDLILIPHSKNEFNNVSVPLKDYIKFVGPIVRKKTGSKNIRKKYNLKKKDLVVIGTVGGGGFSDAKNFLVCCKYAFQKISKQIPNSKYILQTGPFFKGKVTYNPEVQVIEFEKEFQSLLALSDIVVCQGGYNTLNELAFLNKRVIVIPSIKINDDQVERARYMKDKYGFSILETFDPDELKNLIIGKIKEDVQPENHLTIGNKKAAELIINTIEKPNKVETVYNKGSYRIRISDKCNNNCVFCKDLDIKGKELDTDAVKKKLESIRKRYSRITFPCNTDSRSDFQELIDYTSDLGFDITLQTNGRMFSYESLAKFMSSKVDRFEVFLNGTKREHNTICRTDSFQQTIMGIKNLLSLNAQVQVNSVITRYNYRSFKNIVSLIKEIGVKNFRPIFPVIKEQSKYIPKISECYSDIDSAIKLAKNSGINVIAGELFYNPYIPKDLNLDYDTASVCYEHVQRDKTLVKAYDNCNCIVSSRANMVDEPKDISVILPTYNRSRLLKNTLKSLFLQDYPKSRYEVIVVDDGGKDDTLDKIKTLDITCDFKYVYWPRHTPYVFGEAGNRAGPARNIGVMYSTGEVLFFLDSDMVAVPNLLNEHMKHVRDGVSVLGIRKNLKKGVCLTKDQAITKDDLDLPVRAGKMLQDLDYDLSEHESPWFFWITANISVTRDDFMRVGGFSDDFVFWGNEDQELGYRLRNNNVNFQVNKEAIGYHQYHEEEYVNQVLYKKNKHRHIKMFYKKYLDKDIFEFYQNLSLLNKKRHINLF